MSFGRIFFVFALFVVYAYSACTTNVWSNYFCSAYYQPDCNTAVQECHDKMTTAGQPAGYFGCYAPRVAWFDESSFQGTCRNDGGHGTWASGYLVGGCCDDRKSKDSLDCVKAGDNWNSDSSRCEPDTTFKCISVSTENNVIRSDIQYIVHGSVVKENLILGSCIENNFCEGGSSRTYDPVTNPTYAYDSCSYDSVSSQNCNFVGQNGSACNYVCPDGRNWMCRMVTTSGVNIPQCPSKPWKDCADNYVPPKVNTPPDKLNPDTLAVHVPDLGNSGSPYDNVLSALDDISDRIHQQTQMDFQEQYVNEQMYNMVGGYGAWADDGIWQNTKRIEMDLGDVNSNIGETNNSLNSVVINQSTIIKHIENDTIKVSVENDSTKPLWVLPNWTPLVFAIDTNVQKVEDKLSEVNALVDTLVSDTPRTNKILSGIAPSIGQILDNLDTLIDRIPTPSSIINDMSDSLRSMIQPFYDVIYTDSNRVDSLVNRYDWYTPDTSFIQWQPDSLPNDTLVPMDSADFVGPFDDVYNYLDSLNREREKQDTTKDTLPLDQMAGDSAEIRTKLNDVFLTDIVLESCFEFHMHPVVNFTLFKRSYSYDLSIVIDFADMFGWDLCELIRKIVEVLTFIAIVFTTIKGYMRAFGGSNIGG